jgi:glycosyltransferase involved in cell wall biosynthesis
LKTAVLLIGPLPPPMGGSTRHFLTLAEDLDAHAAFDVRVINTSRGNDHARLSRTLLVGLKTLWSVLTHLRRADLVSYHASNRGMFTIGPVIVALCRLARKPVVLRVFGGGFGDFYLAHGRLKRAIIRRLILSADVVLLQTRRSIAQLQEHASGKLVWFSTYIKQTARPHAMGNGESSGERCTRFVFLGHLWRAKGIETMLEAAAHLPADCNIDIYGPTEEYSAEEIDARGMGRIRYRGFLTHDEVDARLWDYDCVVLPTFHPSEGYPGVIAEAYAHALPVITTRWLAIPEITDESCGLLIEPRDTPAFIRAATALYDDPMLWRRLKAGARAKATLFDHTRWSRRFEEICGDLVKLAA